MKHARYLGIDWGEKRIGLALADSELRMALPYKVVASLREVLEIIKEEEINQIIIGQPFSLGGRSKALSPKFSAFLSNLKSLSSVTVQLVDERLSTQEAKMLMGSSRKSSDHKDDLSAMIILRDYLNQVKN